MGATVLQFDEFVRLETLTGGACGVLFAMPSRMYVERRSDGKVFHCPNGHPRCFRETTEEALRRALEAERQARQRAEELQAAARKEAVHNATELRKSKTRLRNLRERVKNGVCPCCKRSFVQLARHMATKHPEYNMGEGL